MRYYLLRDSILRAWSLDYPVSLTSAFTGNEDAKIVHLREKRSTELHECHAALELHCKLENV